MEQYGGRLAMITGAGDGIGAMLARQLAKAGMIVCIQDIRADAAAAVAEEIGGDAFPLVFDVSHRDEAMKAAEALSERGDPLSVLWINAGAGVASGLLEGRPDTVEWAYSVNVLGLLWTAQAFVPMMADETGPRHVGFTASTASLFSADGPYPLYAVTKQAAFGLAEGLGPELAAKGIESTLLCPGFLNTNIWDGARARPERFGGPKHMDPAIAGPWRTSKSPDVMWPAIEHSMMNGGGVLVCTTKDETPDVIRTHTDSINAAIVRV